MELEETFARADAEALRIGVLCGEATAAAGLHEERLAALLSAVVLSLEEAAAQKEVLAKEADYLGALPASVAATVAALEPAKAFYMAPKALQKAVRPGFVARLLGRQSPAAVGTEAAAVLPQTAQAAFVGRSARLSAAFALVDEALSLIARRREALDAAVFSLQERAVKLARGGSGPQDQRQVFAAEEMASLLAGHSDALALHARLLSAVDRSPQGQEDGTAEAAEARMDSILADDL